MSKPRRRVRPADVIEGKKRLGPRALVSLIAEVNPTGRGLKPAEQARRYAQKSALQSLLLRWHGDAFFAEPTGDEGIVLIRHRHFDECACHAQVSSLDDEARAWVWRHLHDDGSDDDGDPSTGARRARDVASPSEHGANAAELLAQAQAALSAYDYELAERLLVGAFELSAGEVSASRALLELLVDVLGQDARALALEPRLSADARGDPPVCSLIGLAAARTGDAARALAIAADLAHPRAGEVCAAAGRAALRAGDVERARACAERARALGAAPEAASLEVAIEEALRARALEEEARLDALVAAGDAEGAEALARELLNAGLPSAGAQRILREAAARRADAAERELSARARAALEAGDFSAARRALDELARLGRGDPALEASLDEAQRAAVAAREARRVSEVLDALSKAPEEGLARYLSLSEPLRARVREAGPAALCERAELVREALKSRRVDDVVAAVQRLGELERALEREDADAALDLAEALPHALDRTPAMGDLIDRTVALLNRRQADWVRAQLDAAFDALAGADWEAASQRLRAISEPQLSLVRGAREALANMSRTVALARELEASVADAREPGADLAALHAGRSAAKRLSELMLELAAESSSARSEQAFERASELEEQAGELTAAVEAALRFEEHAVPEGTTVDLEDERGLGARAPDVRIDRDGRIWFIASPEERCYLTEATLPDLLVTRRFSFSVGGVRRGQAVMPIRKQLWVPLSDGGMLVLDRLTPSTVLDVWWGPPEKTFHTDDAWGAIAPDGTAVVAPHFTPMKRQLSLRALTSAATRPLHHCAAVSFFGRPKRMRALVTGGRRRSWYVVDTEDLTPFGGPERFAGELADLVPIAAIDDPTRAHDDPEGGHVLLAVDAGSLDGEPDEPPRYGAIYLVRVTPDLRPVQHRLVSQACKELRAWLYRVGPDHILVVHQEGALPSFELFDAATLESVGSKDGLPALTVPVQDASGRNHRFLERTHHGFRSVSGPTGLDDGPDSASSVPFLSAKISPRSSCSRVPDAWDRPLYAQHVDIALLKAVSARGDRARLVTIAESSTAIWGFSERFVERTSAELILKMLWRAPKGADDAWGFFVGAEHAVGLCPEDPEVVSQLEEATRIFEAPGERGHSLHLLGLAHLAAGRRAQALAAWREGAAIEGHYCPLHILIAIAGGLSPPELAEELAEVPFPPFVADHAARYEDAVRALSRLDAALEEGRGADGWREARRVRALVGPSWQLSARVARLHLEHPDPATDRWRYQLDLAWMASGAWLGPTRNHMIFAGCHWDHQRFTEVAERAGAALDAMGIGPAERVKDPDLEATPEA